MPVAEDFRTWVRCPPPPPTQQARAAAREPRRQGPGRRSGLAVERTPVVAGRRPHPRGERRSVTMTGHSRRADMIERKEEPISRRAVLTKSLRILGVVAGLTVATAVESDAQQKM